MRVDVGLPLLLEADTGTHFALLHEWLRDCDESHSDHRYGSANSELPTRVLNVGDSENPERLLLHVTKGEPGKRERGKYIEGRTARERCFYVMWFPHGPD